MTQPISVEWSALTHSGSRKERNDDSWLAFSSNASGATPLQPDGRHSLENDDLVFAVSDGMGGSNAGDLASQLILQKMSEIIPETFKMAASGFFPNNIDHLQNAIDSVHSHINEAATGENEGMAATLALAWFTPENLYITNAGDSRIYHAREGKTEQISRDHTLAWGQWKRGEIMEVEYRNHPRRAALYQVIGGSHDHVQPYFAAIPYQPGDRFLICSDGIIDGAWERHIHKALTELDSPTETSETLLKRATTNSGIDDATLIAIQVSNDSHELTT